MVRVSINLIDKAVLTSLRTGEQAPGKTEKNIRRANRTEERESTEFGSKLSFHRIQTTSNHAKPRSLNFSRSFPLEETAEIKTNNHTD